jgi:adenylate cyclase
MQAWLETSTGERIDLRGTCVIGRSNKSQVLVSDPHISRRHALVQQQSDREFWLVDLGSSNGTKLNGRRMIQPCRLQSGDSIRVHTFEFCYKEERPTQRLGAIDPVTTVDVAQNVTMVAFEQVTSWLILTDIQGSSRLTQTLAPDEIAQMFGGWLLYCRDAIEKAGGTVNKYLGDGLFGYLQDAPDVAAKVHALIGTLAARQEKKQPPFRIVLHYGAVTLGGTGVSGEENLTGADVNFVFRLEKVAGKLAAPITLSESAAKRWARQEELTPLGEHPIASFDGTYPIFAAKLPPPPMSA